MKINIVIAIINSLFNLFNFEKEPEYIIEANNINKKLENIAFKNHNLSSTGSGGALFDNIEVLYLNFKTYKNTDINGARSLIVSVTENFINEVNQKYDIDKYLLCPPFNAKHLQIIISLVDEKTGKSIENTEFLSAVNLYNSKIFYFKYDPIKKCDQIILLEAYEEAVSKLKNSKNNE